MSHNSNTNLMERAREMQEYWTGTLHEKLIQHAIDGNDLESLAEHVAKAEGQASQNEFNNNDVEGVY